MKIFLIALLLLIIVYAATWFREFRKCTEQQLKHNNFCKDKAWLDFCKDL